MGHRTMGRRAKVREIHLGLLNGTPVARQKPETASIKKGHLSVALEQGGDAKVHIRLRLAIRSSSGGWLMNSRLIPWPTPPEMPKAAIWSGSWAG